MAHIKTQMLSANATFNGKRLGDMNKEEFDNMVAVIRSTFRGASKIENFEIASESFSFYKGEVIEGNCIHGAL